MELNRHILALPDRLDATSVAQLRAALDRAQTTPEVRVLVLQGAEGRFCRGLDLSARPDAAALLSFAELLLDLRESPKPTVALVDGEALGGGVGLLSACDVVIATPRSRLGLPEALFGLVPAMVLPLVQERVGPAAARRLALRGASISAAEARGIGLVDEVATEPELVLAEQARLLSRPAPGSVRWLKALPADVRAEVLRGAEQTRDRLADPRVSAAFAAFAAGELPWELA